MAGGGVDMWIGRMVAMTPTLKLKAGQVGTAGEHYVADARHSTSWSATSISGKRNYGLRELPSR